MMSGGRFTHFDASGNAVMVDVSAKPVTDRTATARARVIMNPATLAMIEAGTAKKGDVLGVARIAGIMAAKRTSELIPLCHPLPIAAVVVELIPDGAGNAVEIAATVRTTGQTGVGRSRHADRRRAGCAQGRRQVGGVHAGMKLGLRQVMATCRTIR
jgi:molybdenum cofactor biosynthesis protein MoaC